MFIFKRQINIISVQCTFVLYCPGIEKRLLKKTRPLVPFSGHSNNCQHCLDKISKQFLIIFLFIAKGQNKASYIAINQ